MPKRTKTKIVLRENAQAVKDMGLAMVSYASMVSCADCDKQCTSGYNRVNCIVFLCERCCKCCDECDNNMHNRE